jgi:hypothetical protein
MPKTKRTRRALAAVLSVLLLAAAYVGFLYQLQIEARFWHWRHGNVCRLGDFDIAVPKGWLPKYTSPTDLDLIDTQLRPGLNPALHSAIVSFSLTRFAPRDLTFYRSGMEDRFKIDGVSRIVEHTFQFEDKTAECVGGTVLQDEIKFPAAGFISLNCMTTANIDLMFVGQESNLDKFYGIASQIRTHGTATVSH